MARLRVCYWPEGEVAQVLFGNVPIHRNAAVLKMATVPLRWPSFDVAILEELDHLGPRIVPLA